MIKQAIFWSSADLLFGISKENGLIDPTGPKVRRHKPSLRAHKDDVLD
jgi:hypothetical protein